MKNRNISVISCIALAATITIGCNPLKKMVKRQNEVSYEVTPNPLEMHGEQVEMTLSGKFPTKYFNKKVSATITPVIVYGNGTEEAFESLNIKGEVSEAQGSVINYENGGSVSHTATMPYKEGMHNAKLELRVVGTYKEKTKTLDPVTAADGTMITSRLVRSTDKQIVAGHNFKKHTTESHDVEMHYMVNSSKVRSTELKDADIKDLLEKAKMWATDAKMEFESLTVSAYASPEGELSKNDNLANERAESAAKALQSLMKKAKIEVPENFASTTGKGEDWEGFKSLMQQSDIKDKELIIRVLEMYPDPTKREEEIKNLAATYNQVAKKVLPPLRRSQMSMNMKHHNLTDDEIKMLIGSNIDSLDNEQLLYGALLYGQDVSKQATIYKEGVRMFPGDWRVANNLGAAYISLNKLDEAKTVLEKALSVKADATVHNNLGVIARLNGDLDAAMSHYDKASGAGPEVNANKGIINIIKGDYSAAASNLGGSKGFNEALANLLNANNSKASTILESSSIKDEGYAHYLKAIIAARDGETSKVATHLKAAVAKDASLKAKAKEDAEFIKMREDTEFQSAVN